MFEDKEIAQVLIPLLPPELLFYVGAQFMASHEPALVSVGRSLKQHVEQVLQERRIAKWLETAPQEFARLSPKQRGIHLVLLEKDARNALFDVLPDHQLNQWEKEFFDA